LIQAIRVVGRVRGITPSRVGRVRISVSRVRGITMAAVVDLWREHPSRAGQTDAAGPPRARCKLAVAPYRLQGALALITTNSTPASAASARALRSNSAADSLAAWSSRCGPTLACRGSPALQALLHGAIELGERCSEADGGQHHRIIPSGEQDSRVGGPRTICLPHQQLSPPRHAV